MLEALQAGPMGPAAALTGLEGLATPAAWAAALGWLALGSLALGALGLAAFLAVLGVTWRHCYRVSHPPRVASGRDPSSLGLEFEPFSVRTRDGKRLEGWLIPPPAPGAGARPLQVVMCHFLGGGKESLLRHAQYLQRAGAGVVLFDFRCHGQSQDYPFWRFRLDLDLEAVLDWVTGPCCRGSAAPQGTEPQGTAGAPCPGAAPRLAVMGLSMGASAAVLAAARRPEVAALVLDSGPLVLARDYFNRLFSLTGLPAWPFRGLFCALFLGWGGFSRLSGLTERAMAAFSPRPALFIHGENDTVIARGNSERMFRLLASEAKEYWLVPGCYHLTAYSLFPEEYAARVVGFLRRALAREEAAPAAASSLGRAAPAAAGLGAGFELAAPGTADSEPAAPASREGRSRA